MASMAYFESLTTILSNIATAVSIPSGIYAYYRIKKKEAVERENAIYNEVAQDYNDFLKINIEHPSIRVDMAVQEADSLAEMEKRQQLDLFFILVSMLERAHVLFNKEVSASRQSQKDGWFEYMEYFGENENFRRLWRDHGKQFDLDFMRHMDKIVNPLK